MYLPRFTLQGVNLTQGLYICRVGQERNENIERRRGDEVWKGAKCSAGRVSCRCLLFMDCDFCGHDVTWEFRRSQSLRVQYSK